MNGDLIRDPNAFEETWVPPILKGREKELETVKRALNSILQGGSAQLFFHGGSGFGKTALALHLKQEIEDKVNCAYINCWATHTTLNILKSIAFQFHIAITGRNLPEEVSTVIKASNEPTLIILDEIDKADCVNGLLSNFMEVKRLLLIAISNNIDALMNVDEKIGFDFEPIEFNPYSVNQLVEILNYRVKHALRPRCIDCEMVELIAVLSEGDARVAILTLGRAARKAENAGLRKINDKLIKEAHEEAKKIKKSEKLNKLNFHERQIFLIIEGNQGIKSRAKAYRLYSRRVEGLGKQPITERRFRDYVSKMIRECYLRQEKEGHRKALYTCL
jgi:Cdc6-like AAA superfamily ATPase